MAVIDTINIRGNRERCVNLSSTVGEGGINLLTDVKLIQALFSYLSGSEKIYFGEKIYFDGSISGELDVQTTMAIGNFQFNAHHRLLRGDRVIHPAQYQGRIISNTNKPLMMITYLHLLAKRVELRTGDGDYIFKLRLHYGISF